MKDDLAWKPAALSTAPRSHFYLQDCPIAHVNCPTANKTIQLQMHSDAPTELFVNPKKASHMNDFTIAFINC